MTGNGRQQNSIQDKAAAFIRREKLLLDGDRLLLGVSGGADSVCLFFLCLRLREELDFWMSVLYVEHGIRGEESIRDGAFVEALCERHQIPFSQCSVDAPGYSKSNHLSLEEAARMLRYGAFSEEAARLRCNKIATAHNANDNAETILFRLIRGTGVAGLSGIPARREMGEFTVIRPLLALTREEVEAYLIQLGEDYVIDSTNETDDYARNRLRHAVIPVLEELNAKAVSHINEAGEKIGALRACRDNVKTEGHPIPQGERPDAPQERLPLKELLDMSESLRRERLHQWLLDNDAAHNVTSAHIEMLSYIATAGVGKEYHLPGGYYVKNEYEDLRLGKHAADDRTVQKEEILLPGMEAGEHISIALHSGDVRLSLGRRADFSEVISAPDGEIKIPQKNYAKYFDYDKIKGDMVLRHRREGDYIVIHPDGRKKRLKEYFIEAKIPSAFRDGLWLLCQGSKVLYVLGYRTGEDVRVDGETHHILRVEYWRGDYE